MAKTLRPQNTCGACGHTWYPRGKNLSPKCPECGSRETKILMPSVAGTLIVGFLLWVSGGEQAPTATPTASAPVAAVVEQVAEPPASPIPWCAEPVLRSPASSVLRGNEFASTLVRLRWTHDGRVYGAHVESTSGNGALDAVALQAVSEARICGTEGGEGTYAVQHVPGTSPASATIAHDNVKANSINDAPLIPTADFPLIATLQDPDGVVVLQSTPSMLGKNVSKMTVGTVVLASAHEGKWIAVRTPLGETGYVRQRQLRFDEP